MSSLIRSLKQDRRLGHKWLIIGVLSNRYDTSAPVLHYLSRAVWKVHKYFMRPDSILMGICDGKLLDAGRDPRLSKRICRRLESFRVLPVGSWAV